MTYLNNYNYNLLAGDKLRLKYIFKEEVNMKK